MPKKIIVKSVLNKTKKRDDWFLDDYTFNPYSSCSFNCLYCYIRGSKYGVNLQESLSVKENAIEVLDKQLTSRVKKKQYGIIALSSATDPYLQIEQKYHLTRDALEVILSHKFPVHIITKSDLVERDFDVLRKIDKEAILPEDLQKLGRGVVISFSFSTLEEDVASIFEPGAPSPSMRLEALKRSLGEGFLSGVNLMPLIPFISDTSEQLDFAFSTFQEIGVDYILPATITLFGDSKAHSKTLMLNAIAKHYPDLIEKYQKLFSAGHQVPHYYRNAFSKKVKEMCVQFQLKNSILSAAMEKNVRIRD